MVSISTIRGPMFRHNIKTAVREAASRQKMQVDDVAVERLANDVTRDLEGQVSTSESARIDTVTRRWEDHFAEQQIPFAGIGRQTSEDGAAAARAHNARKKTGDGDHAAGAAAARAILGK